MTSSHASGVETVAPGLRRTEYGATIVCANAASDTLSVIDTWPGHYERARLDEPLTALDIGAVALMQELIGEHLSKQGMVIFTTHQPLQVAGVTTSIAAHRPPG